MIQPVTVVINGKTYVLRANDVQGMRDMPANDRAQLIALLATLKDQHDRSTQVVQDKLAKHAAASLQAGHVANKIPSKHPTRDPMGLARSATDLKHDSMGKGDVDQVFAQLVREEKNNQKSELRPATIYKAVAIIMVIIVVISFF